MLRDIKDVIMDYSIIGGSMAILTAVIKPFVSWKTTIRDSVISFIFSMFCGLVLEYWDIPYAVKVGVSGMVGLYAVRLYEVVDALLKRIKDNPDKIIDKLD